MKPALPFMGHWAEPIPGIQFGSLPRVAPGVRALVREEGGRLTIGAIAAERPGSGAVGRYLDSLPADREVWVPVVTSDRLAGMLERRGYVLEQHNLGGVCGRVFGASPVHVRARAAFARGSR